MDKVIKLLPLIYPLLIFAGYIDYVSYYRQFHISIVSYLTTTELLLSFLNITSPLLFLLLLMSVYFIVELSAIGHGHFGRKSSIPDPEPSVFIFSFFKIYKRIVEDIKSFKLRYDSIFFLIGDIVALCMSLLGFVFFVIYFFIVGVFLVENKPMTNTVLSLGFILSLIWFILLLGIVLVAIERIKKPFSVQIFLVSATIAFLSLIAIYNKQESSEILVGNGKYQLSLVLDDKTVNTDSSFLYVGKTEKYFFFYDRKKRVSHIYPTDKVKIIQTSLLGENFK